MRTQHDQSIPKRVLTPQRGFTLLEVMVALLIFSIGLLGLADLQIKAVDYTNGAYQRSQASFLISGIMDRMRANRALAISGSYDLGTGISPPYHTCSLTTSNCTPSDEAKADLYEWTQNLQHLLPSGSGTIARNPNTQGTNTIFTVTVTWIDPHAKLVNGKQQSSLQISGVL